MTDKEIKTVYKVAKRLYDKGQNFKEIAALLDLTVVDIIYLLLADKVSQKAQLKDKECNLIKEVSGV